MKLVTTMSEIMSAIRDGDYIITINNGNSLVTTQNVALAMLSVNLVRRCTIDTCQAPGRHFHTEQSKETIENWIKRLEEAS